MVKQVEVVHKCKADLRKFYDKTDLGVDRIGDWDQFEKSLSEKNFPL